MDDKITLFARKKLPETPIVKLELEDYTMGRETKLTAERDELVNKVKRLKKFMKSDEYKKLDDIDQELLSIQKTQMKALIKTLTSRIDWEF